MQERKYPFPEKVTRVSHQLVYAVNTLQELNVDNGKFLDIYMDACSLKKNPNAIKNQYQYIRRVNGQSAEDIKIRHADYENGYNKVVKVLMNFKPIEFMSEYVAYVHYPKNDSGINNGILFNRFFRMKSGLPKETQTNQIHKILIDPPPEVMLNCIERKMDEIFPITILFTNKRYADIYSMDTRLGRYRILYMSDQCDDWKKWFPTKLNQLPTHILQFCYEDNPVKYVRILTQINEVFRDNAHTRLCLCMPTAYFDRREKRDDLRKSILELFTVLQVVLIDSKAANISPTKRGIFVLGMHDESASKVGVEKAILVKEETGKMLKCSNYKTIDYALLKTGNKTVSALFTDKGTQRLERKRNLPKELRFSPEIVLWASGCKSGDCVCRPKYNFYQIPTVNQKLKNTLPRGKPLLTGIQGGTRKSEDEVYKQGVELLLNHTKLQQEVVKEVNRYYGKKPISLKTFWYIIRERLNEDPRYDDTLCKSIFCGASGECEALGYLMIDSCELEDIQRIIEEQRINENWSNAHTRSIYDQLLAIFDWAIQRKYIDRNPVRSFLEDTDARIAKRQQMRSAMVDCTFSQKRERLLMAQTCQNHGDECFALGLQLRLCTGLSAGSICALNLDDYRKCANLDLYVLSISKTMDGTGGTTRDLTNKWQIRVIPVTSYLQTCLFRRASQLRQNLRLRGVQEEDMKDYPLFSLANDGRQRMKPSDFNRYCNEILKSDKESDTILKIPDELGYEETNVSTYGGDIFAMNFRYKASNVAELDLDEIAYLLGNKPETVIYENYLDHTNPFVLLKLRRKLELWVHTIIP